MTLYVLLYEPVADVLERAPAHFPAHRARLDACLQQIREWDEQYVRPTAGAGRRQPAELQ